MKPKHSVIARGWSFAWALERLFPGERAARFVATQERYGHSLQLVLFGRRLIVDLSHK